jgi:hypothetical protein
MLVGELRVSEKRAAGLQAENGPAFGLHGERETSYLHLIIFKEFLNLHTHIYINYIQFQQSIESDECELSGDGWKYSQAMHLLCIHCHQL